MTSYCALHNLWPLTLHYNALLYSAHNLCALYNMAFTVHYATWPLIVHYITNGPLLCTI